METRCFAVEDSTETRRTKAEKKQVASPKRSEPPQGQSEQKDSRDVEYDRSLVGKEYNNDEVIQTIEKHEEY